MVETAVNEQVSLRTENVSVDRRPVDRAVSATDAMFQTVSIAKAGIITTLNARTSVLASANPIGSKYNPNLPIPQNIDLPPTLLSRFDLVYLMLDKVDEKADRMLARHLVGMYLEDRPQHASNLEILVKNTPLHSS